MKALLFQIEGASTRKCINKDLAGGLGTGTWVGDSFWARIFERVKKSNVVLPEITLAYLIAIFKKAGWEVELVGDGGKVEKLDKRTDLVLVPVSIVDCYQELAIIKKLKEAGFFVAVFGAFATARPDFFSAEADLVIVGEPEAGVLKLVSAEKLPRGILRVAAIDDLDSLPYPDWSYFPLKKYSYSPALNKKPVVAMLASRGCPYSCAFYCPYSINSGKKWRPRSVTNIIGEMEYLKLNYKIKAVDFRDPIFTLNRQRILDLAEQLIEKKLNIVWSCETRVDCLDKELIKKMCQAGLRHINIGIESFSEDVLKKSRRLPIKAAHQEAIIKFCHKIGVSVATFYIIGLEEDTEETINQTIAYAKKLNTLVAQFTIATPYPGTQFFDQINNEGRIKTHNWEDYDTYNPVFEHKNLSREKILQLKEKAFVSYYFRSAYLWRHIPKYFWQKFLCQVVEIRPFRRATWKKNLRMN